MEHMADAYPAEVADPYLDRESDRCTVDDIVMGTHSKKKQQQQQQHQVK